MAEIRYLSDTARATPINDDATLATGVRAAGDYNNDTEQDLYCTVYLDVRWDTTAPSAGTKVAELYLLPGDGEGTEIYPQGGDAGLGQDVTPQKVLFVGSFETISPSITVNEVLALPGVRLYPDGNRFVLLNTSGQTFNSTWELRIKPYKIQSAA